MNPSKGEPLSVLEAAEDALQRCVACGSLTGRRDIELCSNCSSADVAMIFPQLASVGIERLKYENRSCLLDETTQQLELHDPILFRLAGLKGNGKK